MTGSTVYGKFKDEEVVYVPADKDIIVKSSEVGLKLDKALRLKVDRFLKSIYNSSFNWELELSDKNKILTTPKIETDKEILLIHDLITIDPELKVIYLRSDFSNDDGYYIDTKLETFQKLFPDRDIQFSLYGASWRFVPLYDLVLKLTENGFDLYMIGSSKENFYDLLFPVVQKKLQKKVYTKYKPNIYIIYNNKSL